MSTIAVGPGFPGDGQNYSGNFIPALWSGKLIEKFYDATVLAAISNTDYEGEITSYGDKVVIRTKPNITIRDYISETDPLTNERPVSDAVELNIDKGKYWSTVLDDVMEIHSDIDMMSMWADDASQQMKIQIDSDVMKAIRDDIVGNTNSGATAGAVSGGINFGVTGAPIPIDDTNIIDMITKAGQALDENNIPEQGRWMIISAAMAQLIKRSELRDASLTGDGVSILRNGRLGMIDRFTLYGSNLIPRDAAGGTVTNVLLPGETAVPFGHSHGLTFASQLTKVETLRAESTFGTILRGLQVFGYKVVDDTAVGEIVATGV